MRNRAGQATYDRILDAARRLLSERGFDATTVKAICQEAGVQAGSLYHLFESKEHVVLSVVGEAIAAADPGPDTDGLEALVETYVRFVTDQRTLARVYLMVAVSGGLTHEATRHRVLRHHQERIVRFRDALLQDGPHLDPSEGTRRAEAILAALNGYALHGLLDPAFDFAGHARRLAGGVVTDPSAAAGSLQ